MLNKLACLLVFVFTPIIASFSLGQETKIADINDEAIRQTYDSLELKQISVKEVSFSRKGVYVIKVANQKQFDQMPANLRNALKDGKRNIKVKIKKGTYFFKEGYLTLKGLDYPNTDIRIEGKNVVVVPEGHTLKSGDLIPCEVSGESSYVDLKSKKSVSVWSEMMWADSLVEVVNETEKICRLKNSELKGVLLPEGNHAYMDLTRWCRCYQYKVLKIENGYVYFIAHDLEKDTILGSRHYNVNYDFVFSGKKPRFRLCNTTRNEKDSVIDYRIVSSLAGNSVYLAKESNFLNVLQATLNIFSIKGLFFLGGKKSDTPLINFDHANINGFVIKDCCFVGQMGTILRLLSTDNLLFHHNTINNNYEWGVFSDELSSNITIINNKFENNGIGLSYARCVSCFGRDFYVGNNTFKNFGYCAISVGLPYGSIMKNPARGIVEYNHIWYDKEHFENAWKYTIMDSGAIYVWTQNDGTVVRYNYIHDYTGMEQNRGVFCDDGAHHFAIYGNIVVNVPNYSALDSRRVAGTEAANNKVSKSVRNNINNVMMYNLTDGTINFVGNEIANNGCKKGRNLLLRESGVVRKIHRYKPQLKNLEVDITDKEVSFFGHDEKGIIVPKEVLQEIQRLPCYERMKKYIRVESHNYLR